MFGQLVPDGPLHPEDALAALVAGLVVGLAARRSGWQWTLGMVAAALVVAESRHGVLADMTAAPANASVAAVLVVGVASTVARHPVTIGTAGFVALGAAAGVWAVVPDTEAPLIAGSVLVGGVVVVAATSGRARGPSRVAGLLAALPVGAALVGSVGRPGRFVPAVGVAVLGAVFAFAVTRAALELRRLRRQRAGTPTTVADGSTSSTTTAPAPTTAP